ncbi:sensor histidine kinase [Paenibacillus sp. GCM10023252]|uniref:sensor histidine kinase n=1 Tax=Paenibacillus sp. GCM10023252 TaxID=3252649 RepID=UPI003618306B
MKLGNYIRDRLLYIAVYVLGAGLAIGLLLLERWRYDRMVDTGTIWYYLILSGSLLILWLVLDYVWRRPFFKQLDEALASNQGIKEVALVPSGGTREQQAVQHLLTELHSSYLNELRQYRKQQELRDHFIMQWVHHMKTPVSVIDLLAQQGQHEELGLQQDSAVRAAWTSVAEETERLTSGLEMMLTAARLDKFEMDVHPKQLPLHELIRTAVNRHKRLFIRHAIYPSIQGEAVVQSDEKWLDFVLNQLISNAIKYSQGKEGAKQLRIALHSLPSGGTVLELEDEGAGIPSHDLPRVFDPFYTGENGRTGRESTGMGLYLSKQVCDKLGHELTLTSERGRGTRVKLVFETTSLHK